MGSTTNSSSSTKGIDGVGAGPATLTRQSPPPQISAMAMMETVVPQHHYGNELHSRVCDVCGSPFVECDVRCYCITLLHHWQGSQKSRNNNKRAQQHHQKEKKRRVE